MASIERKSSHTIQYSQSYDKRKQTYLLISDIHLDSTHCERALLKKHLDQALEKDAMICIFGDLLDVMATFGDKRMQREDIDPQFIVKGRSYLDLICEYAIEFLKPYAKNILVISKGNHESTIEKFHNSDPLYRIVGTLNQLCSTNIQLGGYKGYIYFHYYRGKDGKSSVVRKAMHYHHGFGGDAKRSKGMLDVQIEVMKYPDAQYLVRGHTHQKWYDPSTTVERLNQKDQMYTQSTKYLQLGSYKNGATSTDGWEVQKNFAPTKMGGWWLEHHLRREGSGGPMVIDDVIYEAE